jgi:UDP-4-amino-4,6-dideoxy-N-acetyl-beta-L-altrosamine transaminase
LIPYGRQEVTDEDINAVVKVLKSDFLTQGNAVSEFENKVAKYVGVKHALAVNSATSALHLACLSLDVGPGDIVWTSPITFVASSNCALYCGAKVDFVDINNETFNICTKRLREKLSEAKIKNILPKVVIPVHLTGQSSDMKEIHELGKEFGFKIIEDASHAIGAEYRDIKVGACTYSDICVFSFHPVKIITTGEGGMALTNNSYISSRIERLRTHGITRDPKLMENSIHGPWYYEQIELGLNYRITDIQAALGISQMDRLDKYVKQRNVLAERYDLLLKNLPLKTPLQPEYSYSSRHLYVIRLCLKDTKVAHKTFFEYLRANNIGVQIHYIPVPVQPYYSKMGFSMDQYPNASAYYQEAISLPLFPTMTLEQQDEVISTIKKILSS